MSLTPRAPADSARAARPQRRPTHSEHGKSRNGSGRLERAESSAHHHAECALATGRSRGAARPSPRRGPRARAGDVTSSSSATAGRPPSRKCRCSPRARPGCPSTSSGATTTPAPVSRMRSAAAPSGGTAARIGRSAARYSNTFPLEHALAAPARFGDEEQERLGVALESERLGARRVRDQLEPVAEAEPLRPLAIGRAEVADEARDGVEPGVRERLEERPRVALPEEAARVRDPEALARPVLEAGEVVEVGAVRDRADDAARRELPQLVGDRVGDARRSRPRSRRRAARAARSPPASPGSRSCPRAGAGSRRARRARRRASGAPVARLTAAPTKWIEPGGDVVITASIPSRRTIRIAAGIAVRFQVTLASGTSRRLRRDPAPGRNARSSPVVAVQLLGRPARLRAEVARRGAPRPASAHAARGRGGSTSDRPARGRASRCRARGGTARA